ncbi:hypothetical protein [Sphingopyxis sp. 550A]
MASLERIAALGLMAAALTACGSQTTANENANGAAAAQRTVAAAAAPVAAPTSPTTLPPAALSAWETFARGQCRGEGERFVPMRFAPLTGGGDVFALVEKHFESKRGGFVTADFNADGTPDFVVTTPGHGCATSGPAYGDQGPPVDFIVSSASGYKAFNGFMGWIAPAMIVQRRGRDVLDLPGGFNGRCGPVTKVTWGWTNNGIDPVERRNDSGKLVDREGCAQASTADGASTAPPVEKGFYATTGDCPDAIQQQYFAYWDGRHIEALGGNRYRIPFRVIEAAELVTNNAAVTATSPGVLTFQGGGNWVHCPTATIPPSVLKQVRMDLEIR